MSSTTFISANHDSGILHAYEYTGGYFKRRCGAKGSNQKIASGNGVTRVAVSWFVKHPDRCKKCDSTFDVEIERDVEKVDKLQEIAEKIESQSQ